MTTSTFEKISIMPTPADIEVAKASEKQIVNIIAVKESPPKYTLSDNQGITVDLSESMVKVLVEAMRTMARGNGIMLAAIEAEVTTQQAAELLNVSRQ